MKISQIVILLLFSLFSTLAANGQKVVMDGFSANESQLLKKLKAIKQTDSTAKAADLVAKGNQLIAEEGFDFFLVLESGNCAKIRAAFDAQQDKSKPLKLSANLQSSGADKAKIGLPDPIFNLDRCTGCFLKFAVLEITDTHLVTKVQGANIKFDRPVGIFGTEAWLLDPADNAKILKKWRIPSRLTPIGISYDANVLYLDLNVPELRDISLAVFSEGTFEFAPRSEAEEGGKSELKKDSPTAARRQMLMKNTDKTFLVSYEPPCP